MKIKRIPKNIDIDFSEITPDIKIKKVKHAPLYKNAFLKRKTEANSEYSNNTTTWD